MAIRKRDAREVLERRPAGALRGAVRIAAREPPLDWSEEQLAGRLTDALWWSYATPLGFAVDRATLEDMVGHVAKKLGWRDEVPDGDGWDQLRWLTERVVPEEDRLLGQGIAWEDLPEDQRDRLERSLLASVALSGSGATAAGAGRIGRIVLEFARTPIGRLLPRIPQIAPAWRTIRMVSGVAANVGTPLGLGLGILALNQALGTSYRRFVPALLATGIVIDRPLVLEVSGRTVEVVRAS